MPKVNGKVWRADVAGAYDELPERELYAEIADIKAANTAGGTATLGAWRTRTLNTIVVDQGIGVTLNANQFTLPAGTYNVYSTAPAYKVKNHATALWNITDNVIVRSGTAEYTTSTNGAEAHTDSIVAFRFAITASKVFELLHRVNTTKADDGFGIASNFAVNEVYTVVRLWKVA